MEQEHQEHQNAVEQESRAKVALLEQANTITIQHIRVTSLCHVRVITPMWHAQRRPEPRWMAWTLGPAAAQVMPKEPPLELEALGLH